MTWREMAPCGACRAPVSRDRGCEHWRPQLSNAGRGRPLTVNERSRRYRERKRAALAAASPAESSEVVAEHRRIMLIKEV